MVAHHFLLPQSKEHPQESSLLSQVHYIYMELIKTLRELKTGAYITLTSLKFHSSQVYYQFVQECFWSQATGKRTLKATSLTDQIPLKSIGIPKQELHHTLKSKKKGSVNIKILKKGCLSPVYFLAIVSAW